MPTEPEKTIFDRPDHADFWWLSELIVQLDGESRAAETLGSKVIPGTAEVVDPHSLEYLAYQRAMRLLGVTTRGQAQQRMRELTKLAGMYHEAFILGARFQAKRIADPQ